MWLAFGTQTRELRDGEIVVGSGADADWRVSTADLMPRHYTLTVYELNVAVRPSSRDNVVVVNGRQLVGTPHLLNDGDVIEAGSGRFVFSEGPPEPADATPAPPARAFLIEDAARMTHPIVNRSTTIGRDASNAIIVADPRASRFHAEIRREAGGFALHSMGSAGTTVNERPLEWPCLLSEGDMIRIASTTFRFSREEPSGMGAGHGPDISGGDARRRPTLSTAQIPSRSDEPDGRRPSLLIALFAILVGGAVVAWLLAR